MAITHPPTTKPYRKPQGQRRGIVLINTGDGKGKSTAAFGLALRAMGRGKAVKIFQFMKTPDARFGEHRMFEKLGLPVEGLGDGFSWDAKDLEQSAQLARAGWEKIKTAIASGAYFLLVCDEITYPLAFGWIDLQDVIATITQRPKSMNICLTGRRCPPELINIADTVTEMRPVRHAFDAGIPDQRGIED